MNPIKLTTLTTILLLADLAPGLACGGRAADVGEPDVATNPRAGDPAVGDGGRSGRDGDGDADADPLPDATPLPDGSVADGGDFRTCVASCSAGNTGGAELLLYGCGNECEAPTGEKCGTMNLFGQTQRCSQCVLRTQSVTCTKERVRCGAQPDCQAFMQCVSSCQCIGSPPSC